LEGDSIVLQTQFKEEARRESALPSALSPPVVYELLSRQKSPKEKREER